LFTITQIVMNEKDLEVLNLQGLTFKKSCDSRLKFVILTIFPKP